MSFQMTSPVKVQRNHRCVCAIFSKKSIYTTHQATKAYCTRTNRNKHYIFEMIINKPTVSSLLILCLLLKQEHGTLASSRRLPFVNNKNNHSIEKQVSTQSSSSKSESNLKYSSNYNDLPLEDRNESFEFSDFERESKVSQKDQLFRGMQEDSLQGLEENHSSKLIEIPLSLTLQHDSGCHPHVSLTTFIDTGAQVTVMTFTAAKRAGLAHLIDTRYAGRACGVAGVSCRVLGRIPANSVSFIMGEEEHVIDKSPAITVIEDGIIDGENHQKVDILLGLDVLQDWQAMICLRDRTLTLRDCSRWGIYNSEADDVVIPFVGCIKKSKSNALVNESTRHSDHVSRSKPTNISSNYDEYLNKYYSSVKELEADAYGSDHEVEYTYDDEDECEESSMFSTSNNLVRGGAFDDDDDAEDDDDDYLDENEDLENFDLSGV